MMKPDQLLQPESVSFPTVSGFMPLGAAWLRFLRDGTSHAMHLRLTQITLVFVIAVLPCRAASVRLSFLSEETSLSDAARLLAQSGCTSNAIGTFERLVRSYNTNGFKLEFPKFPKPEDGFYSFDGMPQLIAALPQPLYLIEHDHFINCFDTVIVLAADRWKIGLRPDDSTFGMFLFSKPTTNGASLSVAATARDMFSEKYGAWYEQIVAEIVPKSLHDARVCFTASLFRTYLLPQSTNEETLKDEVTKLLHTTWKRQSLKFPNEFQVILLHQANLRWKTFGTTHCATLFARKKGYTYIEKAGGRGPFVRLDVENTSELLPWFSFMMNGLEHDFTHLFVSFNDDKIELLEISK